MGLRRAVPDAAARRRAAAAPRLREVFNAAALDRAHRRALALAAPRLPALGRRLRSRRAAGWRRAVFEALVHDLRLLLRAGSRARAASRSAAILDARTLQSTPESGARAGYDGHKRRKGSKVHAAVDTLGHALGPAGHPGQRPGARPGRRAGRARSRRSPASTWSWPTSIKATPARKPRQTAAAHGIQLEVVKLPEAKRGFVLLPRRWVVERSFAWLARFRRLARDYERLPARSWRACTSSPSPASCFIASIPVTEFITRSSILVMSPEQYNGAEIWPGAEGWGEPGHALG